jgi:hypothetical protein
MGDPKFVVFHNTSKAACFIDANGMADDKPITKQDYWDRLLRALKAFNEKVEMKDVPAQIKAPAPYTCYSYESTKDKSAKAKSVTVCVATEGKQVLLIDTTHESARLADVGTAVATLQFHP